MIISSLKRWSKDISISKRLYFIIGVLAVLICIELAIFTITKLALVSKAAGLAIVVEVFAILVIVSISRSIEKGRKEILTGAELIKRGFLDTRIQVYSKDEIGLLSTAFNEMTAALENNIQELKDIEENLKSEKIRAENSEKVKQIFMSNMSHEIRTPMNAILGFARLLQESSLNKEQQEYMQAIIKSADDLLIILNDILDFTKIEEGKMTFETVPFNIRDILKSSILMMQPKSRLKNIRLNHHIHSRIPEIIVGDSVRLNQILLNLVSNSVKFTEQGEITLSAHCIEDNSNDVKIEFIVRDTGIGIPPEKQKIIFESFEQATNGTARRFGGTGLGLSIVKQLVERQGGEIFVDSRVGEGSAFHFIMTFSKHHADFTSNGHMEKNGELSSYLQGKARPIRILIVEDNPVNQLLAFKVLQKRGFEVEIAENGKSALEKYHNNKYDIILMDLQMPEMDGYETTLNIRNMGPEKRYIPIIAMTAHTIKGEFERCIALGMTDYVSKPFHADDLCLKIQALIPRSVNHQVFIAE